MIHCKKGCYTEVNCRVGERKHTHTHTHTDIQRGVQQTLPKKGQKGQKKNKNKVNTVKNLKKGTQCFHFKFQQGSLLARRTGKGEEDCHDYPADFDERWLPWWCGVGFGFASDTSRLERRCRATNSHTTTGHHFCRSLICPQSRRAYVTARVVPAASKKKNKQEHSQPLQLVLSSTQKHTSLSR